MAFLMTVVLAAIGLFLFIRKRRRNRDSAQVFDTLFTTAQSVPPITEPYPPPSNAVSQSAPGIFITYRREDSIDVTGRIYDRLCQRFGERLVFKDVDSIPLGVDFREHLGNSVGQCDVVLASIGRQWLDANKEQRRLNDVRDFVRIEIESALKRGIPVVPVLVQGATLPDPDDLPEVLKSLVYRNGIPVRPDPDFHKDMDRLIKGIEGYLKNPERKIDKQ
ncbi:MAG: toll/interleukin-1 receptor domain-containing protein [Pyrinomonadaceae bacterium]